MAQDRQYLLPLQGDGLSIKTAFVPKYRELFPPEITIVVTNHGGQNACYVVALKLDDKIHDQIAAQPDVFVFPPATDFIDVDAIKEKISSFFLATNFLDSSQQYSHLAEAVLAQMRYSQLHLRETGKKLFSDPGDVSKEVALTDAIDSLHPTKESQLAALNVKYAYPELKADETFEVLLSKVVEERVALPPKVDSAIAEILEAKPE